jgi:hypothetical protein
MGIKEACHLASDSAVGEALARAVGGRARLARVFAASLKRPVPGGRHVRHASTLTPQLHLLLAVCRRPPSDSHIPIHVFTCALTRRQYLLFARRISYTQARDFILRLDRNPPHIARKVPGLRRIANPLDTSPLVRDAFTLPPVSYTATLALYHSSAALQHILSHARPPALVHLIALTVLVNPSPLPGSTPGRRATHYYSSNTTLV